jgi:mRNA interferase MazF
VSSIARGEVWWGELPEVGRRPFLVMTRSGAIPVLTTVLAAPVSRTIRGIPTELPLSRADGMPVDCVATFDNLAVVPKANLTQRICALRPARLTEACDALRNAVDC